MNCYKCGTQLQGNSVFCPKCGAKQQSHSGGGWFTQAGDLDGASSGRSAHTQPGGGFAQTGQFDKAPYTSQQTYTSVNSGWDDMMPKEAAPASKTEKNKVIAIIAAMVAVAVVLAVVIFALGGSNSGGLDKNGNYFNVEMAKQLLRDSGYKLAEDIETRSVDGEFSHKAQLVTEEFAFVTIYGTVELTAQYRDGQWVTQATPQLEYRWKLNGRWVARTKDYDVIMDINGISGSDLSLVLEAKYDGIEGNGGSYGQKSQVVKVSLGENYQQGGGIYDVCLYCTVTGGSPDFQLLIEKDTMSIWEKDDGYRVALKAL